MNLSDPFGRMQRKHQRNYESMCLMLHKADITNQEDAQILLGKIRVRGLWWLASTILLTLLLVLVLPEMRMFVLAVGVLLSFWLTKTSLNSQNYLNRYIREELTGQDDSTSP